VPNDPQGHIDWTTWRFDYSVPDSDGLALLNGWYQNHHIFVKLSMPVIRVKYDKDGGPGDLRREQGAIEGGVGGAAVGWLFGGPLGALAVGAVGAGAGHEVIGGTGAGPYADRISWNLDPGGSHGLQRIAGRGNNEFILLCEHVWGGIRWLEIGVYCRIGAYHIYQAWLLSEQGELLPRVFSKGLTINMDHTHHPYWRFHFGVDGRSHNRLWLVTVTDRWGYYPHECNIVRDPVWADRHLVRNEHTGRGVWIIGGPHDGQPDAFSRLDLALRRYRPEQDVGWPFGKDGLQFGYGEAAADDDIVVWYVAHMRHHAAQGGDTFHDCGPKLVAAFDVPVKLTRKLDEGDAERSTRIQKSKLVGKLDRGKR
jgi:hypothetical protein